MDQHSAFETERCSALARRAETVGIVEVAVRAVDRTQAISAARGDDARLRRMPRIELKIRTLACGIRFAEHAIIGIQPADGGGTRAGRRREIARAETHRFQAFARLRDRFGVGKPQRGFNHHLEADALAASVRVLDLCHQHVERIDIGGDPDLGDEEQVEARTGLDHLDHVAIGVVSVETVDAHAHGLATPVDVIERRDHVLARARLVVRRHRILEIEKHHVRRAAARLLDHFRVGRGDRQFGTVQPLRYRLK